MHVFILESLNLDLDDRVCQSIFGLWRYSHPRSSVPNESSACSFFSPFNAELSSQSFKPCSSSLTGHLTKSTTGLHRIYLSPDFMSTLSVSDSVQRTFMSLNEFLQSRCTFSTDRHSLLPPDHSSIGSTPASTSVTRI